MVVDNTGNETDIAPRTIRNARRPVTASPARAGGRIDGFKTVNLRRTPDTAALRRTATLDAISIPIRSTTRNGIAVPATLMRFAIRVEGIHHRTEQARAITTMPAGPVISRKIGVRVLPIAS